MYRTKPLPIDDSTRGAKLYLTEAVVEAIDLCLPKHVDGEDHENVLYIAGFIDSSRRVGCAVIAPEAETGWGYYSTSRDSHSAVLEFLGNSGLSVVAQVHCHPGAGTEHSDADDDLAFVHVEGHWSLVIPLYGLRGMMPLSACGIHRFSGGQFWLLSPEAAETRVIITPSFTDLGGHLP